jgi:hypothetical protein
VCALSNPPASSKPEVIVARQSSNRPEAEESAADEPTARESAAGEPTAADRAAPEPAATAALSGRALWDEVRISPVEIAMPGGVALTLRAYRPSSQLTPTEVDENADEDPFEARRAARTVDDDEEVIVDEEFAALLADGAAGGATAEDAEEPDEADFADDEAAADKEADEDVPVFLSHRGKLLAFRTPEKLVSFIRSGAPHDLAQLDTWATVAERVQSSDIDPLPEDRYELDLVVENLRGGHDTWDLPLLIAAGEVARDLGFALRLKPVILALSPGSPLDDLDESLRAAESGGMGGFFGRRRLRKIGAQQASLGWRSVIGKISAAVDWRD